MPHLIENSDEDSSEEEGDEESFRTKQLFSFAWQIAKGMVITVIFYCSFFLQNMPGRNAYNGLQGEDSPEKSALFRFPTRKGRDFISFEVYERIRKSVISSFWSLKWLKRANRRILWLWKSREISHLYDLFVKGIVFTGVKRDSKIQTRYGKGEPLIMSMAYEMVRRWISGRSLSVWIFVEYSPG